MLALEAGEVETLSAIRLRYTGRLVDLTAARDSRDLLEATVQDVESQIIQTTVGRVIFNNALPQEMPFINGLLKEKGLQQAVRYCYLRRGLEKTVEKAECDTHQCQHDPFARSPATAEPRQRPAPDFRDVLSYVVEQSETLPRRLVTAEAPLTATPIA